MPIEGHRFVPPYVRLEEGRVYYSFAVKMWGEKVFPLDSLIRSEGPWEGASANEPPDAIRGLGIGLRKHPVPEATWPDTKGMLDAFVSIQGEQDVEKFARRYGVLDLCEHDIPVIERHPCRPRGSPGLCWEPAEVWIRMAKEARAVLNLASWINQDNPPAESDWSDISSIEFFPEKPRSAEEMKGRLYAVVNEWLSLGSPRVTFSPEDQGSVFGFGGGVVAVIAVQLMLAVSNSQRLAVCYGCGHPYTRGRKPQRGRKNYCLTCKKAGVDAKIRKQVQRETKPDG